MSGIPDINESDGKAYGALAIAEFKRMDKLSIEKFKISIELMMENAGLQLARLTASFLPDKNKKILVGVGTGNNGGGGLVAARRLAGWGYNVFLDIPDMRLKPLAFIQFERTLAFGVSTEMVENPDVFIDAYLGFSQRLPLSPEYKQAVDTANGFDCMKISLDLPTGFDKHNGSSIFHPDIILTLAAMKKELQNQSDNTSIYLADIGIPAALYDEFGVQQPDFSASGIIKILNQKQTENGS